MPRARRESSKRPGPSGSRQYGTRTNWTEQNQLLGTQRFTEMSDPGRPSAYGAECASAIRRPWKKSSLGPSMLQPRPNRVAHVDRSPGQCEYGNTLELI